MKYVTVAGLTEKGKQRMTFLFNNNSVKVFETRKIDDFVVRV